MTRSREGAGWKAAALTGASFTGYNIGSGFATGTEAMQFFASWGGVRALVGVGIAAAVTMVVLMAVYETGYEQQFTDSRQIYRYFFGARLGAVMDWYVYGSMILVTLTMMSGAGATIHQYTGLPEFIGAAAMGALCVVTSLLGLEKLRRVLSGLCVVIVALVFVCGAWALCTSPVGPVAGSARAAEHVAAGRLLQSGVFGVKNVWLCGLASGGLQIGSGFAWASATGTMCRSRREARLSGVWSALLYHAAVLVVVYLLLVALDRVAGQEVPMLAVVQVFLPALAGVYSLTIIIAIFSTVSGRLFLIGEHYGGGRRGRTLAIVIGITVLAAAGGAFIPFGRVSNFMFSICGAVGLLICAVVLLRFHTRRRGKEREPWSK